MKDKKIDGVLLRMYDIHTWIFRIFLFFSALFAATLIQYDIDPDMLEAFNQRMRFPLTPKQFLLLCLTVFVVVTAFLSFYGRRIDKKKKQFEDMGFFDMTRSLHRKMKQEGKLK